MGVGSGGSVGIGVGGDRNHRHIEPLDQRQQAADLIGATAPGEDERRVTGAQQSQVTVHGVGRMHEE